MTGPRTARGSGTGAPRWCSWRCSPPSPSRTGGRESPTALFWAAFVLTRPLGAVVGDFLDEPTADGGHALSRYVASAALLAVIAITVVAIPQRAGRHPGDLQPQQEG